MSNVGEIRVGGAISWGAALEGAGAAAVWCSCAQIGVGREVAVAAAAVGAAAWW